ncbi:hypothetical protein NECAME_09787 [Necator americanus]|uniref:Uncharacterized protein n=1 Tax=Necator americanus TaxID=51031 RepID=W2TEW1_NECAM|nr:hypothetical protein NECAME_09787 [Necator americanus]ETN79547.1 hypothetical protein NECAME_09787 [Necator americanus]
MRTCSAIRKEVAPRQEGVRSSSHVPFRSSIGFRQEIIPILTQSDEEVRPLRLHEPAIDSVLRIPRTFLSIEAVLPYLEIILTYISDTHPEIGLREYNAFHHLSEPETRLFVDTRRPPEDSSLIQATKLGMCLTALPNVVTPDVPPTFLRVDLPIGDLLGSVPTETKCKRGRPFGNRRLRLNCTTNWWSKLSMVIDTFVWKMSQNGKLLLVSFAAAALCYNDGIGIGLFSFQKEQKLQ